MKPTHFRPHVERNALSFSDHPFDPWRLRTSRAGESRSPRAVGNLPVKRSPSQDSTSGRTIYSEAKRHLLEENVTVEVPPRTRIRLELRWKNIRDNWDVVVRRQSGEEITIPVIIVTKLSLDQEVIEVE